jgi:hypothetical protein
MRKNRERSVEAVAILAMGVLGKVVMDRVGGRSLQHRGCGSGNRVRLARDEQCFVC